MGDSHSYTYYDNTITNNNDKDDDNDNDKDDVEWREYDIHDETTDQDESCNFLFQTTDDDEWQHLEYRISSSTDKVITLTYQEDYTQSTGMAIWRGSEVLADYLIQNPTLVQNKSVLELGAGVGLVGLVAYHLGASRVLCTDGDERVLLNLRRNIERNRMGSSPRTCDITSIPPDATQTTPSSSVQVRCPQLIWGKQLDLFREEYGTSQVLLGTDLFYMTKSLDPLFQTIDKLLSPTDGIFIAVNNCASQSPMDAVLDIASQYGFQWTSTLLPANIPAPVLVPTKQNNGGSCHPLVPETERIYTFTRK